jgi:hypothetical protein
MLETWWRYLRIAWSKEPVGQHYLRRAGLFGMAQTSAGVLADVREQLVRGVST